MRYWGASLLAIMVATPAFGQSLTVSGTQTTPVRTSNANGNGPGDVTIASGGTLSPATSPAITVDSNNAVTNQGTITLSEQTDSSAIQVAAGVSSTITSTGTITNSEAYTRTDTNADGVLDGPYAQGSARFGIQTLGQLTGSIVNSGPITIQGNNSGGIVLGGPLAGSLSQTGSISVAGDNSFGVHTGAISGDVTIAGTIVANGTASSAVVLGGDIGGALRVNATITSNGFSQTTVPASTTGLTAQNLQLGGPNFVIGGNVSGGANFAAATSTTASDGTVTTTTAALLTSVGSAPGLLVGAPDRAVTLGPIANDADGAALRIGGIVAGTGVFSGFTSHAVQIGTAGQTTTIQGTIAITGSVLATANNASATAIEIGANAVTGTILNNGTISAQVTAGSNQTATALLIDAGAQPGGSLTNSGTITASVPGGATSYAILDRSGRLSTITNSGSIQALSAASNIAIDLSANTGAVTLSQVAPAAGTGSPTIVGDVRLGQGANSLSLGAGSLSGNVLLAGTSNDVTLSGGAIISGTLDFAGASGSVSIGGTAQLTGRLANSGRVAVTLTGGSLVVAPGNSVSLAALNVSNATLTLGLGTTPGTAPILAVSGAANFGAGSRIALTLGSLGTVQGNYTVVQAGSLSGAENLSLTGVQLPLLFTGSVGVGTGGNTVVVSITRRSASELGLVPVLGTIYEPAFAAAVNDTGLGNTLLAINDTATLNTTLRTLLPNFAGSSFSAASLATRGAERILADRDLPSISTGRFTAWVQQVGWYDNKSVGTTAGYSSYGWGLVSGLERSFGPLGRLGVSVEYALGAGGDAGPGSQVTSNQVQGALFWRTSWAGVHAFAQASIGTISFDNRRFLTTPGTGTTTTITATGKWNGTVYNFAGGLSYQAALGRFYLRPAGLVDFVELDEGSYQESGGGGIDLTVDARRSHELAVTGTLTLGYQLQRPTDINKQFLRFEIEGGDRATLNTRLGATTASFAGGTAFTLTPEARTSGWTGATRLKFGNEIFAVTGEASAEKQQSHTSITARLGIDFKL